MTRTPPPVPIDQLLRETIDCALRGLGNLKDIERTASAYDASHDKPLETIKVDKGLRHDILTCVKITRLEHLDLDHIWKEYHYEYGDKTITLEFV